MKDEVHSEDFSMDGVFIPTLFIRGRRILYGVDFCESFQDFL
jgi:hypothetical protein